MGEMISNMFPSVEQRREMFVGKQAVEIVPLLLTSMPEISSIEIFSYQRGYCLGEDMKYLPMEKQLIWGLANKYPVDREVALQADYWKKMAENIKEIHIPHDYPDGSPMEPEETARWYKDWKEDEEEDKEVHLSLSSKVRVKKAYDDSQHIPLLDFKCAPSAGNLLSVKNILIESGQEKGVILHSGQSYHYYGLDTLLPNEWRDWMKLLLRNARVWPQVDHKFVQKSLEDYFNHLRLTRGASKPLIPIVIDVI